MAITIVFSRLKDMSAYLLHSGADQSIVTGKRSPHLGGEFF